MRNEPATMPLQAPVPLAALRSPPLRRVVCALNFQPILRVSDPTGVGIATFQDAIRSIYPELRKGATHELEFRADLAGQVVEAPNVVSYPVWSFVNSSEGWTVSLTRSALSVEADGDAYAGRDALIRRFVAVLSALHATLDPIVCTRLGVRYLNLFQDDKLAGIGSFIQPKLLGYGPPTGDEGVQSSFNQAEFRRNGSTFLIKHGFVNAGFTNEMTSAPLDSSAWMLDIDGFREPQPDGGEEGLRQDAVSLTNGICEFFRQSVTPHFLEEYRNA
jgi:uncharacterized protein (TIGR04255 family)